MSALRFGKIRLVYRRFTFSLHALQALCELTAHPAFGICIKEINFGTPGVVDDLAKIMDEMEKQKVGDASTQLTILRRYNKRIHEQRLLQSQAWELIGQALRNMQDHGVGSNEVAIGVFKEKLYRPRVRVGGTSLRLYKGAYGCEKAFAHLTLDVWSFTTSEMYEIVQQAVMEVQFTPSFFDFDGYCEPSRVAHDFRSIVDSPSFDLVPFMFHPQKTIDETALPVAHLPCVRVRNDYQQLRFNFREEYMELGHYDRQSRVMSMDCLAQIYFFPSTNSFAEFLQTPHLEEIKIQNCVVYLEDLQNLLYHQASTMRRPTLRNLPLYVMKKGGPFEDIEQTFRQLDSAPNLEYVRLERVGYTHVEYIFGGIPWRSATTWQGKKQIAKCVDELLDMMNDHMSDEHTSSEERMEYWDEKWIEDLPEDQWWRSSSKKAE